MEFDCRVRGGVWNISPEGTSRDRNLEISKTTVNPRKIHADIEVNRVLWKCMVLKNKPVYI